MNWIIDPTKRIKMPPEGPTEPAGAFSGGGSYLPSGEQVKRISDLLIEITRHMQKDQSNLDEFERTLNKLKKKWNDRHTSESNTSTVTKTRDGGQLED